MKTIPRRLGRAWLVLALIVLPAAWLPAQTFNALHIFAPYTVLGTNLDGVYPMGGLVKSGGTLYGTASAGGTNLFGTIFSVNTDGSAFDVVHTFATGAYTASLVFTNPEGAKPRGDLILSGGTIYGTAANGGTNGSGTIFSMNMDGSGFTVLHTFDTITNSFYNGQGSVPNSLALAGSGVLYGTANEGGTNADGTLFSINTNGGDFTVLHTFSSGGGENPSGNLLLSGGLIYGTADGGGTYTYGTAYAYDTTSSTFTVLHAFASIVSNGTNLDGEHPLGGLTLGGDALYGTASGGGTNGNGTIFSMNTNGSGFKTLYAFAANVTVTNLDGVSPEGTLTLAGDTLYGTAIDGGTNSSGTIFSICTNGSGFNMLYAFTHLKAATNSDGAHPQTGLILSGGTLFGTAQFGGNAYGSVFSLAFMPVITNFSLAGTNLVLNATNGIAGENCSVLASGDLSAPLNQWTPVATNALSANGSFSITATNAVNLAAPQQFYRLQMQ